MQTINSKTLNARSAADVVNEGKQLLRDLVKLVDAERKATVASKIEAN